MLQQGNRSWTTSGRQKVRVLSKMKDQGCTVFSTFPRKSWNWYNTFKINRSFGLFTTEFGNLQNPSMIFFLFQYKKWIHQQKLSLNNILKRRKQKQKNSCFNWIFDKDEFDLVLVLGLTLVPNWISMGQMAMRCFLTLNQSVNLFKYNWKSYKLQIPQ